MKTIPSDHSLKLIGRNVGLGVLLALLLRSTTAVGDENYFLHPPGAHWGALAETNFNIESIAATPDGDGSPFGVELALGTDPLMAEPEAPGYPVPYPPATGNGITFGFNAAAINYTAWVVRRSRDLSVPSSLVEIFRYDGPTGIITKINDLSVIHTPDTIQITDTTTPPPPAAIYQLSVERSP